MVWNENGHFGKWSSRIQCDENEDDDDDDGETGNKVTTIARELVAQIKIVFLSFLLSSFLWTFVDCLFFWTSFSFKI